MALPKLLQKLFTNGGAGDKLNQDIIPNIPYSKVTDAPSVDSALSATSENPVQNKVINSALDGKLSLLGGTMTGTLKIQSQVGTLRLQTYGATGSTTTNSGAHVATLENDSYLEVHPSNPGLGAALYMASSDYSGEALNKGCFLLRSMSADKTANYDLYGSNTGSLTWRGKNILTGNSAGLTVVAESYSANSWYRKYSDGWIEQGGVSYFPTHYELDPVVITFPIPFSSAQYTIVYCTNNASINTWVAGAEKTKFKIGRSQSGVEFSVFWYVCGK